MKKSDVNKFFLGFTVCTTGKKKLINLFGLLEYIYIYIYLFWVFFFSSSWNEKKNEKKKKSAETKLLGYRPFSVCAGSRYSRLYSDTVGIGKAGRQRAGAHHDTAQWATIRPLLGHDTVRQPAILPGVHEAFARSALGWELGRDTKIVSWLRGGDLVS